MRLAELALPRGIVAGQSSELGTLDAKEGLVALRARHLEPGVGFRERGLDLSCRLDAVGLAESADSGEESEELPESSTAAPADGDCFLCDRQGHRTITEAEVRRRHHREDAAFL